MDITLLIKEQIQQIEKSDKSIYLDAIKIHLERAKQYYVKGAEESDYFNDVIYRTNQAYEGALKESYKVLAQKSSDEVEKETPYNIEKFFETNNVFKERVLELFSTYRSNWRNKSTHDYKLFFDESEAFIALVTVSAFVHLLLKQINDKIIYNNEKKRLKKSPATMMQLAEMVKRDNSLLQKTTHLLVAYLEENIQVLGSKVKENEIQSMINAYFNEVVVDFVVEENPKIEKFLRPDFVVSNNSEKIIIEIKKYLIQVKVEPAIDQLFSYMTKSKISNGILLALAVKGIKEKIQVNKIEKTIDGKVYQVNIIEN